ncbi:unnamed protein product [Moneuplotes crassus]|uniref:Bromo domain-containing protein n=1 Tax=Euplotes crassus TaxID=5936 RepID=A0AAD1XG39_EUPCR|nr:unnamed protein product [Moneuplotes crassus]
MDAQPLDATDSEVALPDENQMKKICRFIKTLKMDELQEYLNENKIGLTNAVVKKNEQPLIFYCFEMNDEDSCFNALKSLVESFKLDPSVIDKIEQTILFYAAREGYDNVIDWLVNDHHLEVDKKDMYVQTPLYYACAKGRENTLLKLIDMGADCSSLDLENQTALFFAARNGHTEICNILLTNNCPVNQKDKKGKGAIEIACKFKRTKTVEFLKEKGADIPQTWVNSQPKAVQKNKAKRKPKSVFKVYRLCKITKGDEKLVTQEEFENDFAQKFPVLYKCLVNNKLEEFKKNIKIAPLPPSPVFSSWKKLAIRIVKNLKDSEGGWMFKDPVDIKKDLCPDYYQVIKKPMDLSTVLKKIKNNDYEQMQEYLDDLRLIFNNCILYNGDGSTYGIAANSMLTKLDCLMDKYGAKYYM